MKSSNEELLQNWYRRLRESQFSHYESAKIFGRMHYWLGIPAIILSALVGTSIFAALGTSTNNITQIFVGLISIVAAVLSGLQTFLRFSEISEKHRTVASRYGAFRREIEEIISLEENVTRELITPLREAIDRLSEEAPNVPERAWVKTKKILSKDKSSFSSLNQV